MRRLAQGHLHTQLGGAGDRTSNLPVTSQPALTPELLPAHQLHPLSPRTLQSPLHTDTRDRGVEGLMMNGWTEGGEMDGLMGL